MLLLPHHDGTAGVAHAGDGGEHVHQKELVGVEVAAVGVEQIVFLSILGSQKIGVVSRRRIERLLEASGIDRVFLRATHFMQNLSGVHRDDIRLRDEVFLPVGDGKTSFVDVRDVAAVAARALLRGTRNAANDLTDPEALDYDDVASTFSVALGRRITYRRPSALGFVRVTRQRGAATAFALFMGLNTCWFVWDWRDGSPRIFPRCWGSRPVACGGLPRISAECGREGRALRGRRAA